MTDVHLTSGSTETSGLPPMSKMSVVATATAFAGIIVSIYWKLKSFQLNDLADMAIGITTLLAINASERPNVWLTAMALAAISYVVGLYLAKKFFALPFISPLIRNHTQSLFISSIMAALVGAAFAIASDCSLPTIVVLSVASGLLFWLYWRVIDFFTNGLGERLRQAVLKLFSRSLNPLELRFLATLVIFILITATMPSKTDKIAINFLPFFLLLLGVFISSILFIFYKNYSKNNINNYIIFDTETFLVFIILSYLLFFFKSILFNTILIYIYGSNFYIPFVSGILWLLSIIIRNKFNNLIDKILTTTAPIAFLPIFYILSIEVHYFLSKFFIIPPKIIYIFFIAIIIISIFYLKKSKPKPIPLLTKYYYTPLIIIFFVLLIVWSIYRTLYLLEDYLHPGNFILPIHQWLQFDQIPYLDIWPAQGLSLSLAGLLYSFIYNYSGQQWAQFTVWLYISGNLFLAVFLFYLLMTKVMRPELALLFAITLGIEDSFIYHSSGLLIILVIINWLIKNPSGRRLTILWLINLAVFAWMPSVAKSTILGSLLFLCIYYIKNFKIIIKALITLFITLAIGAAVYFFLVHFRGHDVRDVFKLIYAYGQTEWAIGSYQFLYEELTASAIFQYYLAPIIFVAFCLYGLKERLSKRALSPVMTVVLPMACFSVFFGLRTLGRHVEFVQFWPIYALPIIAIWLAGYERVMKFFPSIILLMLILLPVRQNALSHQPNNFAIKSDQWLTSRPARGQVYINEDLEPDITFINSTLKPNQSFVEIVNCHLLYAITNRKQPVFHHSVQIIQSRMPQEIYIKHIEKQRLEGQLPLVILRSNFWGSKLDDIPTEQSLFILAEYLYEHYMPWVKPGAYEFWVEKSSHIATAEPDRQPLPISQVHFWRDLPWNWARIGAFPIPPKDPALKQLDVGLKEINVENNRLVFLEGGRYLILRITAKNGGLLSGAIRSGQHSGVFQLSLTTSSDPVDYVIPLKSLYAANLPYDSISFKSSGPASLYLPGPKQ